jgi:hypothetical protein
MDRLDLMTMSRQCCNYLFGAYGIGHACALSSDHCKLFWGLPCEAFARLYPNISQLVLSSKETRPPLKPSTLEEADPGPISTPSKPANSYLICTPSETTGSASGLKICECGKRFTPRCNRQASCDECSLKRRKLKQRGYLKAFRAKSL